MRFKHVKPIETLSKGQIIPGTAIFGHVTIFYILEQKRIEITDNPKLAHLFFSLSACQAGRCEDGKGNYWAIHPANIQDFIRGDFRQRRRSRRRGRKKECDLGLYHVPNGYLQPPAPPLTSGMALNPAALSSIYSPYTEAERRYYIIVVVGVVVVVASEVVYLCRPSF